MSAAVHTFFGNVCQNSTLFCTLKKELFKHTKSVSINVSS